MHCTNGIVVQLNNNETQGSRFESVSQICRKERQRVFKAVPNTIATHFSQKRHLPSGVSNLNEEFEVSEDYALSSLIDFLWVFLHKHSSKIPMWTGFNYMLCTAKADTQSIHTVSYLPAINDSPTKMDVVLELLEQSKLKAEKIGLTETDVVSDQAVYAKCFEVLMNPTHVHLKEFIVLRMGAFHIVMTFFAVIGKRFADGGLHDLIVEAGLIGIQSYSKTSMVQ